MNNRVDTIYEKSRETAVVIKAVIVRPETRIIGLGTFGVFLFYFLSSFLINSLNYQRAIGADGSGTNTVNPTSGDINTTGNTYDFTFTASESMSGGGELNLTVPAGWSAPQGSSGTAGYTSVASAVGKTATVLNDAESLSSPYTVQENGGGDLCGTSTSASDPILDSTIKRQGTNSVRCRSAGTASDNGDSLSLEIASAQDWSAYDTIGVWLYASANVASPSNANLVYDDSTGLASPLQTQVLPTLTAGNWTFVTMPLTATRTAVRSFGLKCSNNACNFFDSKDIYIDYWLLGPASSPAFSGSGPWDVNVKLMTLNTSDTLTIAYGDGGGSSGVTNPSSTGNYTFTTQTKILPSGTLTNIASSPQVNITAPVARLRQTGYHWRNNDGGEADATSRTGGAEDTSITPNKNTTLRLRLQVSNEGSANHSGASFRIEYAQTAACSSGSYTPIPVTATTEHFNMTDATGISDGTATTNIAIATGGVSDYNPTFKAGHFKESENTTSSVSLTSSEFTEIEYAISANNNSVYDSDYCFRVTDNGTDLDQIVTYAQLTMASAPPNIEQVHYRWRNDDGPEIGNPTDVNEGPSGNEVVSTGWTSPTNAYSLTDDNAYATAAPAKNGNISSNFTSFGFDSSLPSSAIINSVTLAVQYKVSTTASVADITVVPEVSGADCGTGGNDASEPLSDFDFSSDVTSCRSWTRDDLLDVNFKVRVNAHRGGSNNAVTFSLDIVKVTVNYQLPGASFKEIEDVSPSGAQNKNENIRLRYLIKNTGGTVSQGYRPQYRAKGAVCDTTGSWTTIPVTAGTEDFEFNSSSNFVDQDATQNINPGLTDPAGTWVSGHLTEDPSNTSNAVALTNGDFTELEYNFQANNNASGTYCFRLVRGASETELDTYSVYPELNFGGGNIAPNNPSSLAQKKTDDTVISTGEWINQTSVKFTATASDTDNPDTLQLCVEKDIIGSSFSNTEDSCGTGVAYSGTPVTVTVTISGIADASEYHWQARVKDAAGDYSPWVSYDTNLESERDFGIDTTAPTGGTVNDGASGDQDWNAGSLTQIDGNWTSTAPNSAASGLQQYEYALRRQSDDYYWTPGSPGSWGAGTYWYNNGTSTSFSVISMNLQTGVNYYISLKTTDNAGNASTINSNGQQVLPTLSFSFDSNTITFADLNNSNNWTDTKTTTFTTSTNASNGYTIQGLTNQLLTSLAYPSQTIANFIGTWASPQNWANFCKDDTNDCGFGYTSNDDLVQSSNRFNASYPTAGTLFAKFLQTPPGNVVADHTAAVNGTTGAVTNEVFTLTHKVSVPSSQAASKYQATATFIITSNY